jgi:hypothetical protein
MRVGASSPKRTAGKSGRARRGSHVVGAGTWSHLTSKAQRHGEVVTSRLPAPGRAPGTVPPGASSQPVSSPGMRASRPSSRSVPAGFAPEDVSSSGRVAEALGACRYQRKVGWRRAVRHQPQDFCLTGNRGVGRTGRVAAHAIRGRLSMSRLRRADPPRRGGRAIATASTHRGEREGGVMTGSSPGSISSR